MTHKITQDTIAQALGLSRNTVSKVFNESDKVAEDTKLRVLSKAVELHYYHPLVEKLVPPSEADNVRDETKQYQIIVLCHMDSFSGDFWAPILKGVTSTLMALNAHVRFAIVTGEEERHSTIPDTITQMPPNGIILMGGFMETYYRAVVSLHIPFVSLDLPISMFHNQKPCDAVMMENRQAVYTMTSAMIKKGHSRIAFLGGYQLCQSFYERYLGYQDALEEHHLVVPASLSCTKAIPSTEYTAQYLYQYYHSFEPAEMPTAFVCANDVIAQQVHLLTQPPYSLAENAVLCGFDNTDLLTNVAGYCTVNNFPEELGMALGELIVWRLNHPNCQFRTVRLETEICGTL